MTADRPQIIPENIPVPAAAAKPLHVHRFSNGAVAITCAGMALHLRLVEACELTRRLQTLYPEVQP